MSLPVIWESFHEIAQEFLVSSDPRLRRNTSVALAAIGGADAMRLLVDLATNDGDPTVRQQAASEISQLSDENVAVVKQMLIADMMSTRGSAKPYALAATMVNADKARFRDLPFFQGVRYAWMATALPEGRSRMWEIWSSLGCCGAGILAGWAVVTVLCSWLGATVLSAEDQDGIFLTCATGLQRPRVKHFRGNLVTGTDQAGHVCIANQASQMLVVLRARSREKG